MKKNLLAILTAAVFMAPTSAMAADFSFGKYTQTGSGYQQSQSLMDRILELNDNAQWVQDLLGQSGMGDIEYTPSRPNCDEDSENEKPNQKPEDSENEKPNQKPGDSESEKPSQKPGDSENEKPSQKPGDSESEKPNQKPGENETPDNGTSSSAQVNQILSLVNAERAKNGLSPLKLDSKLTQAAQVRAKEQAQSFSHTRPNGSQFYTAIREAGLSYTGAGENVAMGQKTAQEVMNAWMNSSGHRANILNKNFTTLGVGVYTSGNTTYWAQLFTY